MRSHFRTSDPVRDYLEILIQNLNKPPSLKQLTYQTELSDRAKCFV